MRNVLALVSRQTYECHKILFHTLCAGFWWYAVFTRCLAEFIGLDYPKTWQSNDLNALICVSCEGSVRVLVAWSCKTDLSILEKDASSGNDNYHTSWFRYQSCYHQFGAMECTSGSTMQVIHCHGTPSTYISPVKGNHNHESTKHRKSSSDIKVCKYQYKIVVEGAFAFSPTVHLKVIRLSRPC